MNHNDLLSLYTHTERFDDEHFIYPKKRGEQNERTVQ